VFIGWFATEITFFTACQPFEGYWGMPPPDPQCTTLQKYAIVQGCFNISSDVVMICIPMRKWASCIHATCPTHPIHRDACYFYSTASKRPSCHM
jgi:hypothetical protein